MLAADKSAFERDLRVQMLSLQWKELQYLHTNFQNLATCSSVLVGFGFAALGFSTAPFSTTNTSSLPEESFWLFDPDAWSSPVFVTEAIFQAMFSACASLALGFNLLSLFIATISSMCGPGMALRGPEGSVHLAVRHMEQQLKRALRFFGRGVVAILLTLTTVGLRNLQDVGFIGGFITIGIGCWTFHALWTYGAEIGEKFHVSVLGLNPGPWNEALLSLFSLSSSLSRSPLPLLALLWLTAFGLSPTVGRWRPTAPCAASSFMAPTARRTGPTRTPNVSRRQPSPGRLGSCAGPSVGGRKVTGSRRLCGASTS